MGDTGEPVRLITDNGIGLWLRLSRTIAEGDPMTARGAVFFALSAAACNANSGVSFSGGLTAEFQGRVNVLQGQAQGRVVSSVGASFARVAQSHPSNICAVSYTGSCTLTACPDERSFPSATHQVPTQFFTPSYLRLDGAKRALELGWVPGAQTSFQNYFTPLWDGGELLTIAGGGDPVPAFVGSVVAPAPLSFTSSHPAAVQMGQDLPLTWSKSGAGTLQVRISTQVRIASCSFSALTGNAAVPREALTFIGPGNAMFAAAVSNTSIQNVGTWQVEVDATHLPVFSDGTPGNTQIVIQ